MKKKEAAASAKILEAEKRNKASKTRFMRKLFYIVTLARPAIYICMHMFRFLIQIIFVLKEKEMRRLQAVILKHQVGILPTVTLY